MKYCSLIFFLIFYSIPVDAQINYVLNPSFEKYDTCPDNIEEIKRVYYWTDIDSLAGPGFIPDYINTCGTGGGAAPNNFFFYQYPRTGNGMIQIVAFVDQSYQFPYRDNTQGRLYKNLIVGKTYCVTFYVSLDDQSTYAVNNIGAYLDGGQIDTAVNTYYLPQTQYTPQVLETAIISDTINWVKVQGSFIATGNERFITIGNFFDYAHTTHVVNNQSGFNQNASQYLIDDVSVIASDAVAYAGPDVPIGQGDSAFIGPHEIALPYTWYIKGSPNAIDSGGGIWVKPDTTTTYVVAQDLCGAVTYDTVTVWVWPAATGSIHTAQVQVFPNPVHNTLTIGGAAGAGLSICNMLGQVVYAATIKNSKESIDMAGLPEGIYLYRLMMGNRLIKQGRLLRASQ